MLGIWRKSRAQNGRVVETLRAVGMTRERTATAASRARPARVVRVRDTISPTLAGRTGVSYQSPPQPREEALAWCGCCSAATRTQPASRWTCPIAGGQRTVTLEPAAASDERQPTRWRQRALTER